MTQDVVREVDREEEISQSDAEPVNETSTLQSVMKTLTWETGEEMSVVAMNTRDQNANDVAEPVFAVVLDTARNSFDGTSGMIGDALLHDERFIAVGDKFTNASDEKCRTRTVACPAA